MVKFDSPLCSKWSSFLWMGIFLIIVGTLALSAAVLTTYATVMFVGILLIVNGLSYIVHGFYNPEWKGLFLELLAGILSTVIGWLLITSPTVGALSLTLMLAAFFIATGLFKVAASLVLKVEHWGWLMFNGIVAIVLGGLIFAQWPVSALWILGVFVAIDMIFSGWANTILGLRLRKECSTGNKVTQRVTETTVA